MKIKTANIQVNLTRVVFPSNHVIKEAIKPKIVIDRADKHFFRRDVYQGY
jgi:hypothetical protein